MPRLSIVIPWREGSPAFEDTLISVLQHRPDLCEIVVVHAEPYDDPYELAGEVRFIHVPARNDVALINAGIGAATAEFVHVLRCGVEVQEGWAEIALRYFIDPAVASVTPVILQRSDPQRLAAAGVSYTRGGMRRVCAVGCHYDRWTEGSDDVVAPLLAAGFYRRPVLLSVGGFEVGLEERFADVDLGLTFAALGFRCAIAAESLVVADPERAGPSFQAGRAAEQLYWRHAPAGRGVGFKHAAGVLANCCTRLPSLGVAGELLGRIAGAWKRKSHQAYQKRVAALASTAAFVPARATATRRTLRQAA